MQIMPSTILEISHSKRGLQTIEKTWASLGFEWFGAKNPILKTIKDDLESKGISQINDESGVLSIKVK